MRIIRQYRPHEATFKGKHNEAKAKTLVVLYHLQRKLGAAGGLSLRELAEATGIAYETLAASLGKWTGWKYLKRRPVDGRTRPVYRYSIAERGIRFVEQRIPRARLEEYIQEIKTFRANAGKVC